MTFDKDIAIESAELIQALYLTGIPPTIDERATDTQVLIRTFNQRTYVAFPGTASFRDGITDLRAVKKSSSLGGRIHAGFRAAHQSVISQVLSKLVEIRAEKILVTGHSLGGALAMLTAKEIQAHSSMAVEAVYTFGQPRVGNGAFARAYDAALKERTFRVVNEGDPVPASPPWALGYRHAGQEVYLHENGGVDQNRGTLSKLISASGRVVEMFYTKGITAVESVQAHSLNSYLAALKQGSNA